MCIQVITPMHRGSALASRQIRWIASAVVSTGLGTTRTGIAGAPSSPATTREDCASTCRSVSGP